MKTSLIVSAGRRCFMACKGCYQNFGTTLLETSELVRFVSEFKSRYNLRKITLSGGDPLTRKDIILLIDTLAGLGLSISMDTTGLPIIGKQKIVFHGDGYVSQINAASLENVDMLGIPLDGHNTEVINKFRSNITLEDTKKILAKLDLTNISVCINTVVNLNNFLHLQEIYEIIKKFNCVKKWQLFQYSPIGEIAYRNRKKFEITNEMFDFSTRIVMKNRDAITIEPKSNSFRKRKYILVNSDGQVWTPMYSKGDDFTKADEGTGKIIFGYVQKTQALWDALDNYFEDLDDNGRGNLK